MITPQAARRPRADGALAVSIDIDFKRLGQIAAPAKPAKMTGLAQGSGTRNSLKNQAMMISRFPGHRIL
jgi:hypothetical protein